MDSIKEKADICLNNIVRTRKETERADIKRSAHLKEIAYLLSKELPKDLLEEEGEDFRRFYNELCAELSFEEKVELCVHITDINKEIPFAEKLLELSSYKNEVTVVYVKNALSDIAFERFSKNFGKVQVYYSKADYAILPLASSKNGRICHFTELALRHEMKTVLSCSVHSNTDESDNTFILCAKSIEFLFDEADKDIRFEFLLNDPSENLAPVLAAATKYGCGYITSYTSSENDFVLVELDVTKGEKNALCLYLFLEFSRHIPIGIYTVKKQP